MGLLGISASISPYIPPFVETVVAQEATLIQEAEANHREFSKEELKELTRQIAEKWDVPRETMEQVVECESQWNTNALNKSENSRGLSQIHQASWPDISDEQAYNPVFALNFLAEKLSKDQGYLWTCYRNAKD